MSEKQTRPTGSEIPRELKNSLNEEGFEGDEEGKYGAAVLVGSREEVGLARERLETEGRATDLRTYLRMHKTVCATGEELISFLERTTSVSLPAESLPTELSDWFRNMEKGTYFLYGFGQVISLYYKDSEGALAKVHVKFTDIDSYKVLRQWEKVVDKFKNELAELGFAPGTLLKNSNGDTVGITRILKDFEEDAEDRDKASRGVEKFNF